jgi:excisionase family DNA binding protein
MTNDKRFLTPPQAAKLLGVGAEKVKAFIDRGELVAINLSMGDRPRWRIAPDALQVFLKSRSNVATKATAPKQAKRSPLPKPSREYV